MDYICSLLNHVLSEVLTNIIHYASEDMNRCYWDRTCNSTVRFLDRALVFELLYFCYIIYHTPYV